MATNANPVEDVAAQRKERLRALRVASEISNRQGSNEEDGPGQEPGGETKPEQDLRFRNYLPHDKQFEPRKLAPPSLPMFDDPLASAPLPTDRTEDPILSIAPKKANWDLRRDVAEKVEKLERRTQRAIVELMQEEEKHRQALVEGEDVVQD